MVNHRTLTSAITDSRDFIAAKRPAETEVLVHAGQKSPSPPAWTSTTTGLDLGQLDRVHAKHPDMVLLGWVVGQYRRDYHRKHLYVLDLPSRSCRQVEGFDCRWDIDVIELDEDTLAAVCLPPGSEMAPALTRLVRQCARDADPSRVWFGDPEHGQQAFGAAARALGGVDAGAWLEVARYGQCIDAYHQLYFREQVVPHFLKMHGWREESFHLAIADIAQVRGNLGDNLVMAWRGKVFCFFSSEKKSLSSFLHVWPRLYAALWICGGRRRSLGMRLA